MDMATRILISSLVLCIGANWMHEPSRTPSDDSIILEGFQQPLWSWLVLCDDSKSGLVIKLLGH